MAETESKLLIQLRKQSRNRHKSTVEEERLEDAYQTIAKTESKNLMFIELLTFLVEKGFVLNEHKVDYFFDLYDRIKTNKVQQGSAEQKTKQAEQEKFNKKKFVKLLHQMGKDFYPNDALGFEKNIYKAAISNEHRDDVRIKMDENIKKLITKETVRVLKSFEKEFEIVFEIYLPQNFNVKMGFTWFEIKYLEKKLPIAALFRFLCDCEAVPNYITAVHFIEVVSKVMPAQSVYTLSGQKETFFYTAENFANYSKEAANLKKIKLIEGDFGVTYFEMEMLLVRLSIDVTKEKNDIAKSISTFLNIVKLKQVIANKGQAKSKPNKFEQNVKNYFEDGNKVCKSSFHVQKRETKKKIQQILQQSQQISQQSLTQFKDSNINVADLVLIKKSLDDDHLPHIPDKPTVDKENDSKQEKNKPFVRPKEKKKDDTARKFKNEEVQPSHNTSAEYLNQMLSVPSKQRVNHEFPIILNDAVYPNDIPNLVLSQKCEILIETVYIHLSERSYERAFVNYVKARTACEPQRTQITDFYFDILEAQIYGAAARDGMALLNYHKAKGNCFSNLEMAQSLPNKDTALRCIAYNGLGCSLHHLEEYEYALRCFLKVKQLKSGEAEVSSVENAVLQNNIGCVFMVLNRNNEALKCFALSHSILDLKLGKFNEKSVVAQQNANKNKKAFIEMIPIYPTMWKTFIEKPDLKPSNKLSQKK